MPNGAVIEGRSAGQRAKHKSWRAACAATARDVADHDHVPAPLDGPLGLSVEFRFPGGCAHLSWPHLSGLCSSDLAPPG